MSVKLVVTPRNKNLKRQDLKRGHVYRGMNGRITGHVILIVETHFDIANPKYSLMCLSMVLPEGQTPSWTPWFPDADDEFEFLGKLEVA